MCSYGLRQAITTPRWLQWNGMLERLIRSLKERCAHRQRFESLGQAGRAIGDWVQNILINAHTGYEDANWGHSNARQPEQIPPGPSSTRAIITQNRWKNVTCGLVLIILVVMSMDTVSGRLRRKSTKVDCLPMCEAC
ncbi:MAG: hypothetical protein AAFN27_10850 [Pseudomonadota bacterium]